MLEQRKDQYTLKQFLKTKAGKSLPRAILKEVEKYPYWIYGELSSIDFCGLRHISTDENWGKISKDGLIASSAIQCMLLKEYTEIHTKKFNLVGLILKNLLSHNAYTGNPLVITNTREILDGNHRAIALMMYMFIRKIYIPVMCWMGVTEDGIRESGLSPKQN